MKSRLLRAPSPGLSLICSLKPGPVGVSGKKSSSESLRSSDAERGILSDPWQLLWAVVEHSEKIKYQEIADDKSTEKIWDALKTNSELTSKMLLLFQDDHSEKNKLTLQSATSHVIDRKLTRYLQRADLTKSGLNSALN
jgi:hypothetical protein